MFVLYITLRNALYFPVLHCTLLYCPLLYQDCPGLPSSEPCCQLHCSWSPDGNYPATGLKGGEGDILEIITKLNKFERK